MASIAHEHASVRDPDQAIRGRLTAIVIDGLIVGSFTRTVGATAGFDQWSANGILLLVVVQFLYFFGMEAQAGQTIGKRAAGVRVATVDGSPLGLRQAAVRNVLRVLDAFPLLYASGLISVMRTGRGRRQRMGDMAAGTTVLLQPGGQAKHTPGWLLPVCTVVAAGLSVLAFVVGGDTKPRGREVATLRAAGFPGDNTQAPVEGVFHATGTTTSSVNYGAVQGPLQRDWSITRDCSSGTCAYVFQRQLAGEGPVAAPLTPGRDGWHAEFAPRPYVCGSLAGQPVYWQQHSTFVLRFTDGGRTAHAHERSWSYEPHCGGGTNTIDWTATSAGRP